MNSEEPNEIVKTKEQAKPPALREMELCSLGEFMTSWPTRAVHVMVKQDKLRRMAVTKTAEASPLPQLGSWELCRLGEREPKEWGACIQTPKGKLEMRGAGIARVATLARRLLAQERARTVRGGFQRPSWLRRRSH